MEERKDIVGNVIKIGDEVAYNPPYYKGIKTGTIVGFTPKGIRLSTLGVAFSVIKVIRENV